MQRQCSAARAGRPPRAGKRKEGGNVLVFPFSLVYITTMPERGYACRTGAVGTPSEGTVRCRENAIVAQ